MSVRKEKRTIDHFEPCKSCEGTGTNSAAVQRMMTIAVMSEDAWNQEKALIKCHECKGYGTIPVYIKS